MPPLGVAKERVPEPFVFNTWSAVPSVVGKVNVLTKDVRLLSYAWTLTPIAADFKMVASAGSKLDAVYVLSLISLPVVPSKATRRLLTADAGPTTSPAPEPDAPFSATTSQYVVFVGRLPVDASLQM